MSVELIAGIFVLVFCYPAVGILYFNAHILVNAVRRKRTLSPAKHSASAYIYPSAHDLVVRTAENKLSNGQHTVTQAGYEIAQAIRDRSSPPLSRAPLLRIRVETTFMVTNLCTLLLCNVEKEYCVPKNTR